MTVLKLVTLSNHVDALQLAYDVTCLLAEEVDTHCFVCCRNILCVPYGVKKIVALPGDLKFTTASLRRAAFALSSEMIEKIVTEVLLHFSLNCRSVKIGDRSERGLVEITLQYVEDISYDLEPDPKPPEKPTRKKRVPASRTP